MMTKYLIGQTLLIDTIPYKIINILQEGEIYKYVFLVPMYIGGIRKGEKEFVMNASYVDNESQWKLVKEPFINSTLPDKNKF